MDAQTFYRPKVPFVYFLLSLAGGMIFAFQIPSSRSFYFVVENLLFILCSCFILIVIMGTKRRQDVPGGVSLLFYGALACLGSILVWRNSPAVRSDHFSHFEATYLSGYVSDDPVRKESSWQFEFTVLRGWEGKHKRHPISGKLLVQVSTKDQDSIPFSYGEELVLKNRSREISPAYNPEQFSYASYQEHRGIRHSVYLSPKELRKTGRVMGNWMIRWALKLRRILVRKYQSIIPDPQVAAFLSTLILGQRSNLDEQIEQVYIATGTVHVLSVSGLHVELVSLSLTFCLRKLPHKRGWLLLRLGVLLSGIWFYALLAGFAPSVLRSAAMISILTVGEASRRSPNTLNSLAASAFLLLLNEPHFLYDVGFQLSYLSVAGMLCAGPALQNRILIKNRFGAALWNMVAVSLAAQALSFPCALFYFHSFPVYFLPANLIITLPVTVIMYLGLTLLMLPDGQLAAWIAQILEFLVRYLNEFLSKISEWPQAVLPIYWIDLLSCCLLYLAVFLGVGFLYKSSKGRMLALLLCLLGLGLLFNKKEWERRNRRELVVFNVRKELAIALFEGKKAVLFSTYPTWTDPSLQYAVAPCIAEHGALTNLTCIPWPSQDQKEQAYRGRISFQGYVLSVLGGKGNPPEQPKASHWILLRNNQVASLSEWLVISPGVLVIVDASNTDRTILQVRELVARHGARMYVLKDNFAYVWKGKE